MGQIKTDTIIHLDFIDSLKILFGKRIKVLITIDTLEEVSRANAHSNVEIIGTSDFKTLKDKPDFGFEHNTPEAIKEETTKK